jgi:hypothetical protein
MASVACAWERRSILTIRSAKMNGLREQEGTFRG